MGPFRGLRVGEVLFSSLSLDFSCFDKSQLVIFLIKLNSPKKTNASFELTEGHSKTECAKQNLQVAICYVNVIVSNSSTHEYEIKERTRRCLCMEKGLEILKDLFVGQLSSFSERAAFAYMLSVVVAVDTPFFSHKQEGSQCIRFLNQRAIYIDIDSQDQYGIRKALNRISCSPLCFNHKSKWQAIHS